MSCIGCTSLLFACSGGGGDSRSDTPSIQTATITGVAAEGAPMAKAQVTLTDATGHQTGTTADANGNFSISVDVTKYKAPYGFEAVDPAAAAENQESILVTTPAAGSTTVVNITPLTTAVAAGTLSSGSPYDVSKPAVLSTVSPADVTAANNALVSLLGNLLRDANVALPVDLISSSFTANHTGLDQVLDEVLFVPVGTGVQLTNKLNYAGASQVTTVSKGNIANLGSPFRVDFSSSQLAASGFDNIKSTWLACFAQPPATRLSNGTLSPVCQAAASSSPAYRSNGYTFAQDFASWFADSGLTNATMVGPSVVYASSATRMLLQFTLIGPNGTARTTSVVAQFLGSQWQVTGNQEAYDVSILSYLIFDQSALRGGSSRSAYISGIMPVYRVGPGSSNPANTRYVLVKGPGFPTSGVVLAPNPSFAGMRYWPLANQTGTPATTSATSGILFGLAQVSINADGTTTPAANPANLISWSPTAVSDYSQFAGFPAYTFELHFADGTMATETKRLQYSVVPPANGTGFVWDPLSNPTLALLTGSQPTASSIALSWTRPLGAPAAAGVIVTASDGTSGAQNTVNLSNDATSVTVSPPTGTSQFPAMTAPTAYRWFQLTYQTPASVGRYSLYNSQ